MKPSNENSVGAMLWLFIHSLILPFVWMTIGVIFDSVVPGKRLGIVGTALLFQGVATLISWLFVRKYRRHFTKSERFLITGFCAFWAILLELCVLLYATGNGRHSGMAHIKGTQSVAVSRWA